MYVYQLRHCALSLSTVDESITSSFFVLKWCTYTNVKIHVCHLFYGMKIIIIIINIVVFILKYFITIYK